MYDKTEDVALLVFIKPEIRKLVGHVAAELDCNYGDALTAILRMEERALQLLARFNGKEGKLVADPPRCIIRNEI